MENKYQRLMAIKEDQSFNQIKIKVCLDYAKSITWSNGIIVGVNSFDNYLEIMENFSTPIKISNFSIKTLRSFYSDPRNWIDS